MKLTPQDPVEQFYLDSLKRIGSIGKVQRALEMYDKAKDMVHRQLLKGKPDLEGWQVKYMVARQIYAQDTEVLHLISKAEELEATNNR